MLIRILFLQTARNSSMSKVAHRDTIYFIEGLVNITCYKTA